MAAPVRKDEEVELQVDSLAYGGNGVARLNGFVVFVRRGLPGDRVRARVTKVKRGFAEALAVDVLEPSPHRVEAPCAHYPACGGCRFQDLAYEVQAAAKEEQVRDALKRIGGIADAPVEPILPAESQFFYRNKLEYSFTQTPSGPALGFHKAGRWDEVLEIEKCWLTTDLGNAIRNAVRDWAREENLEAYDQAEHTGYLRHLVYREGRNTGQVLVVLVTAPGEKFERDYFVEVLRRFPEVKSIHWAINDQPSEVTNLPSTLLWGDDAIEEELLGRRFRVRPNAFLQTNTEMAEQLYALAIEYAGLTGTETVYDLYCGTGTIGLSMAKHALSVWGVDISEESIACALENLDLNQIGNAAFFAGNVGQVLEELAERAGPADVVVVDPPRAGLAGKALRRTGELGAPKLVYISCNPTTLASDVKVLREQYGYELVRTKPVDMFPHTPHVETVSLLTRERPTASARSRRAAPLWSGGNALRPPLGVARGRPGARGGVEQVRLGHAGNGAGEDDPRRREQLAPAREPGGRVLRLEHGLAGELAERDLRVHLDHALVHLGERVHLEDLPAERERLLRDPLAGDRARDLVRLREGPRLERLPRRRREDAARAAAADEARAPASACRTPRPGGSIGMSTAITRACDESTSEKLGVRRDLDVAARVERDGDPALAVAVDAGDEHARLGLRERRRRRARPSNPSWTSRASATFIASGLSSGTRAIVSPLASAIRSDTALRPVGRRAGTRARGRAARRAAPAGRGRRGRPSARTLAPFALQALDLVLVGGELLRVGDVEVRRDLVLRHDDEPVREVVDEDANRLRVPDREAARSRIAARRARP